MTPATGKAGGQTPIVPKSISKVVDTSGRRFMGAWTGERKILEAAPSVDPRERSLKVVRQAREVVLVYSPIATDGDLNAALENLSQSGVRVYALTSSLEPHKGTFRVGLMRERKEVSSTVVLVDPVGEESRGLWFGGELSRRQTNIPFMLDLEPVQVRESWAHISCLFWRASGSELFFGRLRNAMTIRPRPPVVEASLNSALRDTAIPEWLRGKTLDELWMCRGIPPGLSALPKHVNELVCEISQDARKILAGWPSDSVHGSRLVGLSLARAGDNLLAFRNDIGFVLSQGQVRELRKAFPAWPWTYRKEVRIADVERAMIRPEGDWDSPNPEEIQDSPKVPLPEVVSPSFQEWNRSLPTPDLPPDPPLARQLEYTYYLAAPALPKGVTKHPLYGGWTQFETTVRNRLTYLERVLTATPGVKNKDRERLASELRTLKGRTWGHSDPDKTLSDLARLETLDEEIVSTALAKSPTTEKADEIAILEPRDGGAGVPNRRGKGGTSAAGREEPRRDLRAVLPIQRLPSVGTLYELSRSVYLAIRFVEEIDAGIREAEGFNAKLVSSGDGRPGKA